MPGGVGSPVALTEVVMTIQDWSHIVTGSMIERVRAAYQAGLLPAEIAEGEGCPVELIERFVSDVTESMGQAAWTVTRKALIAVCSLHRMSLVNQPTAVPEGKMP